MLRDDSDAREVALVFVAELVECVQAVVEAARVEALDEDLSAAFVAVRDRGFAVNLSTEI